MNLIFWVTELRLPRISDWSKVTWLYVSAWTQFLSLWVWSLSSYSFFPQMPGESSLNNLQAQQPFHETSIGLYRPQACMQKKKGILRREMKIKKKFDFHLFSSFLWGRLNKQVTKLALTDKLGFSELLFPCCFQNNHISPRMPPSGALYEIKVLRLELMRKNNN